MIRIFLVSSLFLWAMVLNAQNTPYSSQWSDPAYISTVTPQGAIPAGYANDRLDFQVYNSINPQTENSIAINPTNPDHIILATNGRVEIEIMGDENVKKVFQTLFESYDGGITWSHLENGLTPNGWAGGDPVVFFDVSGNAYWCTMANAEFADEDGFLLYRKNSGTSNWDRIDNPLINPNTYTQKDKEHGVGDQSGKYPDNIYFVWTDFGIPNRILFSRSQNKGNTFNLLKVLQEQNFSGMGANVQTGLEGEIYVCWANYNLSGTGQPVMPEVNIAFAKSINEGNNWEINQTAFTVNGIRTNSGPISELNNTRANSWPTMKVDHSNSPYSGRIYIVYADKTTGNSDIYLRISDDNGTSWSNPKLVNTSSSNQQWFPSLAVDQTNGNLYISFYSMDGTGFETGRYLAKSTDGGTTFTIQGISDSKFTPKEVGSVFNPGYMGDYYETAAHNGRVYATWSDNRTGQFQAYVQKISPAVSFNVTQKTSTGATAGTVNRFKTDVITDEVITQAQFPKVIQSQVDFPEILQPETGFASGQKSSYWNHFGLTKHAYINDFLLLSSNNNQTSESRLDPPTNATLYQYIDGVDVQGTVQFKDPWLPDQVFDKYNAHIPTLNILQNQGQTAPFYSIASGFQNIGLASSRKGVFKNKTTFDGIFYEVKADQPFISTNITADFLTWTTTGTGALVSTQYTVQPVVFTADNATVSAFYKGRLKTAQPANSNSKNQRRLAVNGNTQLLVYESMSDIWVTASFDDGVTWLPEKRVTKRTGYAANPSLSALITSGSALKGLVTWSEVNASGQTETYLQSITLSASQLYFGWASLVSSPVDNTNRRKLNDFGFSTLPQAGASPTLSLNGSTVVIAYKGTNAYLIGGKFTVGADLNSISGLVTRNLSTDNTSKQANVIHLDANSGFGAKDFVYYAKSNGSSEPVYQYDWDAQTTLQCDIPAPTGTGQYSCESLQASGSNGTVTFVYQGAASSGPDVLYYVKAGYNDRPVLSVRYLKGEKPAVTDQATSAYSVTGRLVFRSTDPANSGNWFSVVGSGSATSIGSLAVGMYTRDQGTGSSFMFTSSETPLASLKRYTGSGQLLKGEGGIQMNYTFNRWWADQNGVKHPVVLDFTGVTVEPEGSMEQGNVICAVKVVNSSDEEILVSQPDTLVNNLAISIFRDGQVIRAYKPSAWSEISTQSLTGLMPDDILLFSVPETVTLSLGFTDVELKPADGMNKRITKEKSKVDLAAVNNEIAVYPNPFNPVTTLTVSVNTPSLVSIQVFNILGQVVADFGRNQMGAGKHSVQFDGHNLASGTYFYRVEIGNEVKTGKLQLLK